MDRQLGHWEILQRIKNKYTVLQWIHPIKQETVERLLDYLYSSNLDLHVGIFGSATTHRCNFSSDLDILVWGKDKHKFRPKGLGRIDIIYPEELDEDNPLWNSIEEEGLHVFR